MLGTVLSIRMLCLMFSAISLSMEPKLTEIRSGFREKYLIFTMSHMRYIHLLTYLLGKQSSNVSFSMLIPFTCFPL